MAKQESNRRHEDKNKSASLGPDPTINKSMIEQGGTNSPKDHGHTPPAVIIDKTPIETPKSAAVPTVPTAKPAIANKRARARQMSRSKSVDDARMQIFHRVGKGGLALGEPVPVSRDDDIDESE